MTPYRRYNHLSSAEPSAQPAVKRKQHKPGAFELQCLLCGVLLAGVLIVKLVGGDAYLKLQKTFEGIFGQKTSSESSVAAENVLQSEILQPTSTVAADLTITGDEFEQAVEYIRQLLPSGLSVDQETVEKYARTYLENLSKQQEEQTVSSLPTVVSSSAQLSAQMSIDEVLQLMSELSGGENTVTLRVETVSQDGDLVPTALLTGTDLKKTDTFAQKAEGGLLEAPEGTSFAPFFPSVELRNPLDIDFRISSEFGYRYHPVTGMFGFHTGVDLPAALGTYIYAAAAGKVVESGYSSVWGNYLLIRHDDHTETFYAHCKKLRCETSDKVKKGQVIATVGSTGTSTGAHLHYEVRIDGVYMDPEWILQM